jgi:ubiquitin-protein ligase
MALKRLQNEYSEFIKEPNELFSISIDPKNFFIWNILIFGPEDTIFEGGVFNCKIEFTQNYPNKPPSFKFIDNIYHPNIYPDGKVCISILHEGVDVYGYEDISERWNPSHSVNSILMSIISILTEPNFESPANVDASKLWKENYNQYKKIIYNLIVKNDPTNVIIKNDITDFIQDEFIVTHVEINV